MSDQKAPIIVKRVKKVVGGHHGGAWKVAYADLMTAMMAFFLVMWLVTTMLTGEKRSEIAGYFKYRAIFQKLGQTIFDEKGNLRGNRKQPGLFHSSTQTRLTFVVSASDLRDKLRKTIEHKLGDLKEQVQVTLTEEGVRIDIMDNQGKPLFQLGSSELNPNSKVILKALSENLNETDNKLVIEGHTDALEFPSSVYTNWELSTARASSARLELEKSGLDIRRISMVAGFAATRPVIKADPEDPRNRRISIVVLYPNLRVAPQPGVTATQPE
ncbi:MAG TPA: OmpA family protein [Candidatus Omnitrophota bacterium]|nr:OmpA family protein [Candidatus Omnitrophota bacterium]HRZ14133.1 OmpA family protein [Candidatus Omnitrophota bacterium]